MSQRLFIFNYLILLYIFCFINFFQNFQSVHIFIHKRIKDEQCLFWCNVWQVPCGSGRTSQRWRQSRRTHGCRKPYFLSQSRYSHQPWQYGDEAGICAWSWVLSAWGRVWEGEIDRPVMFPEPHTGRRWKLDQTRGQVERIDPIYVELLRFDGWHESSTQSLFTYLKDQCNLIQAIFCFPRP